MLRYLDHVNLRTRDVARLERFYCGVLGLTKGARPPFTFGGAWLYCGERAVVHLVEAEVRDPAGELRLEHFAFAAEGLSAFVERLRAAGVSYRVGVVPELGVRQVKLEDPDGNRLHVDFSADEPLP